MVLGCVNKRHVFSLSPRQCRLGPISLHSTHLPKQPWHKMSGAKELNVLGKGLVYAADINTNWYAAL